MTGFSFSGLWYIDELFAHRMKTIIQPRLDAGKDPIPASWRMANTGAGAPDITLNDSYAIRDFLNSGLRGVAVVPITGTMSRFGELCGYGNEQLARWLMQLERMEEVRAVVLKMHTPGGTVDSTRMLADLVKAYSKPIVVHTAFCASAGYFVASQADEIWMEESSVAAVGSIGVLMVYENIKKKLQQEGRDMEIIRADGSEKKALLNSLEDLSDETRAEIRATLNAARTEFLGYVRRGRVGKLTSDDAFSGDMFKNRDALRLGLTDRTGTLQQALNRALQLAKSNNQ